MDESSYQLNILSSLLLHAFDVVLKHKPKICLSISNHHPEHWQPSWSVRTALLALIAFMPTNPNGALGSLDYTKEERRSLAIKSCETSPRNGTPERQKLIDAIHEYMLSKAPPVPQATSLPAPEEQITERGRGIQESPENPAAGAAEESLPSLSVAETTVEERRESASMTNSEQTSRQLPAVQPSKQPVLRAPQQRVIRQTDDRIFTWAAIGLKIAIVVLILKKYMKANRHGAVFMDES